MSKYFDKDFFKFLFGFIAMIAFSLIIILATRIYQDSSQSQTANVIDSTKHIP